MESTKIITSEFVSYGHPDKVADQISDALLDAYIEDDKNARVGIETMIKDNVVILGGEVKANARVDVEEVVRSAIDNVKYPNSHNLHGDDIKIINLIGKQSVEISNGVDKGLINCDNIGAGDQGFVVGMASNETSVYLPLGVYIARQICQAITHLVGFGPDIKTQVTVDYNGKKPRITTILVSTMHRDIVEIDKVRDTLKKGIMTNSIAANTVFDSISYNDYIKDKDICIIVNPNGPWTVGGPISDCGVTGRKIVVDQYGGYCKVGGGAYSGKDMSKVDRSAAYMCRYLAKNIVDAGIAETAKVELSYIIGRPCPCAINVELEGEMKSDVITNMANQIKMFINKRVDLTPSGIIRRFFPNGVQPIFYNTARNGHYGFSGDDYYYPWEKTDLSLAMREFIDETEANLK